MNCEIAGATDKILVWEKLTTVIIGACLLIARHAEE
jgi:hypothetical protein